jgi:hypothetical protein
MPTHWDNEKACGLNWGHWTQWDEQWYLKRLEDIAKETKEGVPFSGNTWQSKLRGVNSARALNKNLLQSCNSLFAINTSD